MNCLGWTPDDVIAEESYGGDYSDYTISTTRRALIVEAKKEGEYFDLPAGDDRLERSIPALCRDYPKLKDAILQVCHYCQSRGVPLAAVTNGHQLVAFVAIRTDGVPPLDGRALVFPSLETMVKRFLDLWQAMSKPGVVEDKLRCRLLGTDAPDLPAKLSTLISAYPGFKNRNPFQTDLQIVSEIVLEDLAKSRDMEPLFLKECYCQSGALSQHSLTHKAILQARYAALFDSQTPGPATSPLVGKKGLSPELLADSFARRPILLIGDVGVGKTTFLRHFIQVDSEQLLKDAISLYLDLGSQGALTSDLRQYVLSEMEGQLRSDHSVDIEDRNFVHGVYHSELQRFARGIYSDLRESNTQLYREKEIEFLDKKLQLRDQHLRASLEHLSRARRKQIVVFLDNADQRDDATQQIAFLMAEELAAHWPAMVFVALRPETFHSSLKRGTLSGYHPKAFTIAPPRADQVIKRRLRFGLKITSGDIPSTVLGPTVGLKLKSLDIIIRIFLDSLTDNDNLLECIDNVSAGNIRLALDLVKSFFGSGHIDTEKVIRIYEESGSYIVPLHEFLRAIIYGDSIHYDPNRSPVANLFGVSAVDSREHFLLPLMLGFLHSSMAYSAPEGFVGIERVYATFQGAAFTVEQIDGALSHAVRAKLVETTGRKILQPSEWFPGAVRITSIGIYHVLKLTSAFPYFDAVVVDTPIFDDSVRNGIREVYSIEDRISRAELFQSYLDAVWQDVGEIGKWFDWRRASKGLSTAISKIRYVLP